MTVKEHYDNHLGGFYAWMTGDFDLKLREQADFFQRHNIVPQANGLATDLGAGHGLQSIALARAGFHVTAVDFNKQLLEDLRMRAANLTVRLVEGDILQHAATASDDAVELTVCMGDTLTHLHSEDAVGRLLRLLNGRTMAQGKLILSFRDLTQPLAGTQRFIPVRSDDQRIFTCFLEYFPGHVMVHDMVHEKQNGSWVQKISAYPKLRISETTVATLLAQQGWRVHHTETINRMIYMIAVKD